MRPSDSPHAASPTALVAGTTASREEARERGGTPIKPFPDALRIVVRELARQAAVDAWRWWPMGALPIRQGNLLMKKGRSDRPETSPPQMFTVSEVAERTNMSMAFWRREVRLKRIAVTYFGGRCVSATPIWTPTRRGAGRPGGDERNPQKSVVPTGRPEDVRWQRLTVWEPAISGFPTSDHAVSLRITPAYRGGDGAA